MPYADARPVPRQPPDVERPAHADRAIRGALAWATHKHPRHAVDEIRLEYVDASGILDEQYGRIRIEFGLAQPEADDPKRRTGLPITAPSTGARGGLLRCVSVTWTRARNWEPSTKPCREVPTSPPRCTAPQIWQRAIDRGAPKDAFAIIVRSVPEVGPPEWLFAIKDAPRKVDLEHLFVEDCPLVVEQAPPP